MDLRLFEWIGSGGNGNICNFTDINTNRHPTENLLFQPRDFFQKDRSLVFTSTRKVTFGSYLCGFWLVNFVGITKKFFHLW